jgi:hypothetical protein
MTALNLILAVLAAGGVAAAMSLGFFAGGRPERRGASVAKLTRRAEPEREAA